MSLEANLERNNQLLTQQNELLAQILKAMASGASQVQKAAVQEYHEIVPDKEEMTPESIDPESLDFSTVIALAGFFPDQASGLDAEMIKQATEYQQATGDNRVIQIDALEMALIGVKRATSCHKEVLLKLARTVISLWDELPGIKDRRAFAEKWLDAKPAERASLKPERAKSEEKETQQEPEPEKEQQAESPDYAAQRKEAGGLILQLAKGGYRAEAIGILDKFGAQKLGQVTDADLAEVITLAEKALEG